MAILAEHLRPDFAVRVLQIGGRLRVGIYAYENIDCPHCGGSGWLEVEVDGDAFELNPCSICSCTGEVRRVSGQPAAESLDDDHSLERQYLALWRRYGRLDVRSISDYWMHPS